MNKADNVHININARLPGEEYGDYRVRRIVQNAGIKRYLREGTPIWDSMRKGAYVRRVHGPIGEQRDTKQQRRKHGQ